MNGEFQIEPLGGQDRKAFNCGVPALDRYFQTQVSQDVKRLMASCFVVTEITTGRMAGFYTLAASSVRADDLPAAIVKRLPRYPVLPAALIGRLAVDLNFQGRKLGAAMLGNAVRRVMAAEVRAFAIIVDAKDESAVAFYVKHGFAPFLHRPMSLLMSLSSARLALA